MARRAWDFLPLCNIDLFLPLGNWLGPGALVRDKVRGQFVGRRTLLIDHHHDAEGGRKFLLLVVNVGSSSFHRPCHELSLRLVAVRTGSRPVRRRSIGQFWLKSVWPRFWDFPSLAKEGCAAGRTSPA